MDYARLNGMIVFTYDLAIARGFPTFCQCFADTSLDAKNSTHAGLSDMSMRLSLDRHRHFEFIRTPRGVGKCLANVLGLEIGIKPQNVIVRMTARQ